MYLASSAAATAAAAAAATVNSTDANVFVGMRTTTAPSMPAHSHRSMLASERSLENWRLAAPQA